MYCLQQNVYSSFFIGYIRYMIKLLDVCWDIIIYFFNIICILVSICPTTHKRCFTLRAFYIPPNFFDIIVAGAYWAYSPITHQDGLSHNYITSVVCSIHRWHIQYIKGSSLLACYCILRRITTQLRHFVFATYGLLQNAQYLRCYTSSLLLLLDSLGQATYIQFLLSFLHNHPCLNCLQPLAALVVYLSYLPPLELLAKEYMYARLRSLFSIQGNSLFVCITR